MIKGQVQAGVALETERSRAIVAMDPRAGFWDRYPWMLKLDLVVDAPDAVWIVGLALKPRMTELGQLLVYRSLYEEQYRPQKPIRLAHVSRADAPEMRKVMEAQGIAVFVIPEV